MDPELRRRLVLEEPPVAAVPDPGPPPFPPGATPAPSSSAALTWLAFGVVVVPFAVAALRFLITPGSHVYLPDDLALIDLHTRRALAWRQQLGVFDHNNWNHPGPAYFYLLSIAYRVLGSGARAMFVGATVLNGLAAAGCVEVVRRRSTPLRTLWAALWVCILASVLASVSTGSTTYSEGPLGALVSPWNPLVVVFPLLLLVLLCAAAVDRSKLSLLAAAIVGSFVVQTDISVLPLVVVLVALAAAVVMLTARHDRRGKRPPLRTDRRRIWGAAGLTVLVLMWIPPVVQQVTNHPGNVTLIYRFFTASHPGQSLEASLRTVVAAFGVTVVGPSEIMSSLLGGTPAHVGLAVAVTVVTLVLGAIAAFCGWRGRSRFAAGLGGLTLAGCAVTVIAVMHIVGFVFGYLVIWAVVLPVSAVIAVGMVPVPPGRQGARGRAGSFGRPMTAALALLALLAAVVLTIRVARLPALGTASDPGVQRLTAVVVPALRGRGPVFVGDAGAGTRSTQLLDTERFIGLVNQLDVLGYRPTVNGAWKAQFGPGYLTSGHEPESVQLSTWSPSAIGQPGYAGRAGDIAVAVTRAEPTGPASPGDVAR